MSIVKTVLKNWSHFFGVFSLKFLSSDVAFYLYKATLYLYKMDLHRILLLCLSWLF